MFKSIRWYITFWFVALSSTVYLLLSLVGGAYFYNSLSHAMDEELRVDASQIGHAIDLADGKPTFRDWLRVVETEPARSIISMQLFDPSGKLLEHFGPIGIPKLYPNSSEVTEGALTVKVRPSKLIRNGKAIGFLQLQLPVDKRNTDTREFFLTMAVMAPFVLLAFGVCSYAVAGMAVKPIEELVATLRLFVADAGHELNTPASVVQARAQSLERKLEKQGILSEDLSIIASSAERMGNIVQDLMLLAELDAKSERKVSLIDFAELSKTAVLEYNERFAAKDICLSFNSTDHAYVAADTESLERILRNLLENALKYTERNGMVSVTCEGSDVQTSLTVEDTGIGIPSESLPQIFERFYRVDKSRTRASGGSGLGLSIVKAIVESLGGRVSVVSDVGKGSKFSVVLPVRKSTVAQKLHIISS